MAYGCIDPAISYLTYRLKSAGYVCVYICVTNVHKYQ